MNTYKFHGFDSMMKKNEVLMQASLYHIRKNEVASRLPVYVGILRQLLSIWIDLDLE